MQVNFTNQLLENFIKEKFILRLKKYLWCRFSLIRYLLFDTDLFSKYARVIPIKDEEVINIVNAFQSILDSSKRKPNRIWVDQGN